MKKTSVKILSLVLTLVVAFACIAVPGQALARKNIKFVVLGDSVARGSYVEDGEEFGAALANQLSDSGYNVNYINYAVPKYDTRSVYYDLHEDTYAHDNDRYVAELGAKDLRAGISYDEFIGNIATSDFVVIHLGENNLAAAFYKLLGYNDYYEFYGDEINIPKVQNDINNGRVNGIYTCNSFKIAKVKAEFEQSVRYYLDLDIKRIKEINPDAQVIVCDMFNPYKKAGDALSYMTGLMQALPVEALGLLKSESIGDFFTKFAALTANYNTLVQLMAVMIPGLTGNDMDHCAKYDLSSLTFTQKILFKLMYIRDEKACVEMYDIANEVIPEVVAENDVTLCELSKTNVNEYMAPDGSHPSKEGHEIIADTIYDIIDFDKVA